MAQYKKLSNPRVNNFRILVRKATLLTKDEESVFYAIPEEVWANIFETNFNSELTYAEKVILGSSEKITHTQSKYLERVKRNLDNFDYSLSTIKKHLNGNKKVFFITDFDNDGSISQAIINQFKKTLPINEQPNVIIEYARSVGGNSTRGFSGELVDLLVKENNLGKNDEFLIITADNGVNSRNEQIKINQSYPNATLLITDHHNPEPNMMVIENEQTIMFNPHYQSLHLSDHNVLKKRNINTNITKDKQESYNFFSKYNISGASTIGLLLSEYIKQENTVDLSKMSLAEQLIYFENNASDQKFEDKLKLIEDLSRISNMIDYVHTAPADKPYDDKEISLSLYLQSLLNTNNSVSNLITKPLTEEAIDKIINKSHGVAEFKIDDIIDSYKKIKVLNALSGVILEEYNKYTSLDDGLRVGLDNLAKDTNITQKLILDTLSTDSQDYFSANLKTSNNNYIEQLRPLIYELSFNDKKTLFEEQILDEMMSIYRQLQQSERKIINELRKIELLEIHELDNSVISVLDSDLQHIFNRKLINKAYNRTGSGFNLIIDNIKDDLIAGSFRSAYPISEILTNQDKKQLAKELGIKIETPGHEHAAGFLITRSKKGGTLDYSVIIPHVNHYINQKIQDLKLDIKHVNNFEIKLKTDFLSIDAIDKINKVIRGQVAHFARITPIVQLNNEDMVYIDPKTDEQILLKDKAKEASFGWTPLQLELGGRDGSGKIALIPNAMINELDKNGFTDFVRFNYLNDGVFIAESIVPNHALTHENTINLEKHEKRHDALIEYYDNQVKNSHPLKLDFLNQIDLMDNPFFKFNAFSHEDFSNFEEAVIKILNTNNVDNYTVFDVEAIGLGNAKLINIGIMNYMIDDKSGIEVSSTEFKNNTYYSLNGEMYFIKDMNPNNFIEISLEEYEEKRNQSALSLLSKDDKYYYMPDRKVLDKEIEVKNIIYKDNQVVFNQHIKAETVSYLVKPDDFIIPSHISQLTGITNQMAKQYGYSLKEIDTMLTDYYKDKKTLFIAHNTSYDARVCRVNLPNFSNILRSPVNLVADSAEFSKNMQLMYDDKSIIQFSNIPILKDYFFYNNPQSDLSFEKFIESDDIDTFPDVKNQIHILKVKEDNLNGTYDFFVRDVKDGTITKINISYKDKQTEQFVQLSLKDVWENSKNLGNILTSSEHDPSKPVLEYKGMGLNHVGYNAQGLGENKAIKSMLLQRDSFKVNLLSNQEIQAYPALIGHEEKIKEFQEEFRFNMSIADNITNFMALYDDLYSGDEEEKYRSAFYRDLKKLSHQFLEKNKHTDSAYDNIWWYQSVLRVFEPKLRNDLNNVNYDIVSYLTGIPHEFVKTALNASYEFQQQYKKDKCLGVIPPEEHMNGPYKGNIVGDIAYEDKATLLLLVEKFNNHLNPNDTAIDIFNASQKNYYTSFLKQDLFSGLSAFDSMSFAQHVNHSNQSKTIKEMEERLDNILNSDFSDYPVIKFQLNDKVLQQGKHVYAVVRDDTEITAEDIKEDAKKLSFIIGCLQVGLDSKGAIDSVFQSNAKILKEYKSDLMDRYYYIEQNNSMEMLDGYVKDIHKYLSSEINFEKIVSSNIFNTPSRSNVKGGIGVIEPEMYGRITDLIEFKIFSLLGEIDDVDLNKELIKYSSDKKYQPKNPALQIFDDFRKFNQSVMFMSHDDFVEKIKNIQEGATVTDTEPKSIYKSGFFEQFSIHFVNKMNELEIFANNSHNSYLLTQMDNLFKIMLVNSVATHNSLNTPTRIQNAIYEMRLDENVDITLEPNNFTDKYFLSSHHSSIKRLDPTKHLMEKMNYVDYIKESVFSKLYSEDEKLIPDLPQLKMRH